MKSVVKGTTRATNKPAIPRKAFHRVVRMTIAKVQAPTSAFRISKEAVRALHEVTEHFMVMMFEGANMIASNAHRTLVYERDIHVMGQLTKK
jgi:histone H3/H4